MATTKLVMLSRDVANEAKTRILNKQTTTNITETKNPDAKAIVDGVVIANEIVKNVPETHKAEIGLGPKKGPIKSNITLDTDGNVKLQANFEVEDHIEITNELTLNNLDGESSITIEGQKVVSTKESDQGNKPDGVTLQIGYFNVGVSKKTGSKADAATKKVQSKAEELIQSYTPNLDEDQER